MHGNPDVGSDWEPLMKRVAELQAERQRRVFPRARIEILPGVGHWAWLEQPDRVAGLVVPFLRGRMGAVAQKPTKTRRFA